MTYREPQVHGPDYLIQGQNETKASRPSRIIASLVEGLIMTLFASGATGLLWMGISRIAAANHASVFAVAGGVGGAFALIFHHLTNHVGSVLKLHLNLKESLTPYFGRKIEKTFEILKGHNTIAQARYH
jgi:hypothetical protein